MTSRPADGPAADRRPTLGFVGIHAGRRKDQPVSQNETLAALFVEAGLEVRRASAVKRPSLRTLDQILSILSWRTVDALVIAVFSGRSFWIADFASRLGRLTGKRVVLFLHGGNLPVFGPEHRGWVMRVLSRADLVLAPSEFLAATFREWGLDVRIVPNVLAIENYDYSPRTRARPNLLWMRTFHEHYDPLMALHVLSLVIRNYPEARLTMAGADHGLLAATKAEADRLGLRDRVTFPGYIDAVTKREAFDSHDLYLNTNVVDNMPVSLLEASASGLVPVATGVGGIPAMLGGGEHGVLVPSGDAGAMAEAVIALLGDDEYFARMSAGARALAEHSAWPAVHERWSEELGFVLPGFDVR